MVVLRGDDGATLGESLEEAPAEDNKIGAATAAAAAPPAETSGSPTAHLGADEAEAARHPFVKQVLDAFPGAEIKDVGPVETEKD